MPFAAGGGRAWREIATAVTEGTSSFPPTAMSDLKGQSLPIPTSSSTPRARSWLPKAGLVSLAVIAALLRLSPSLRPSPQVHLGGHSTTSTFLCQQHEPLLPALERELSERMASQSYQQQAIAWLSGAVQRDTESYDIMGPVGEDERWEKFGVFQECG